MQPVQNEAFVHLRLENSQSYWLRFQWEVLSAQAPWICYKKWNLLTNLRYLEPCTVWHEVLSQSPVNLRGQRDIQMAVNIAKCQQAQNEDHYGFWKGH